MRSSNESKPDMGTFIDFIAIFEDGDLLARTIYRLLRDRQLRLVDASFSRHDC
jgi:hypothetical protein